MVHWIVKFLIYTPAGVVAGKPDALQTFHVDIVLFEPPADVFFEQYASQRKKETCNVFFRLLRSLVNNDLSTDPVTMPIEELSEAKMDSAE